MYQWHMVLVNMQQCVYWKKIISYISSNKHFQILTHLPKCEILPVAGTDDSDITSDSKSRQIASTQEVNVPHQCCINTVSKTNCGESDSSRVMSSQYSCQFETVNLHPHTGASLCARTLEVGPENIETAKNGYSELKDVGRNMRYCEDDDDIITATSQPLSEFMEHLSLDELAHYWLSDKELRLFVIMDIVFPALKKSTCFTKRYTLLHHCNNVYVYNMYTSENQHTHLQTLSPQSARHLNTVETAEATQTT